ncbi:MULTISPECIES: acyltransferase family protein [Methylobacterium]|uniref:O-acetyltransferase OatA n=1 Tax=Methylobacterium thuringiense TaxID=1003091 RepID=A0ABQ4TQP1_9HYPH|nr:MULTISPECIES: acyltransferase [Methylobacterium]TXN19433.1 acyltransferase [Methylobacterium sp. WL9]GJE57688.1 O-acetyltransferase OatA [Methylobacterium thuringiense]
MSKEDVVAYPWSHASADDRKLSAPALPAGNKLPAIQALRGAAVLLVVLFHALTRHVPFGWVGVWLFFTISGFVITLSLEKLSSNMDGRSVLLTFYQKRAKRIIPLYVVILLGGCLICTAMMLAGRSDVPPALDHLPFLLSFTYNFYRMMSAYEHTELFGHLWSLCVEEQFYVVYPFAFLLLSRIARIRLLVLVILACPLGRLCLNLYLNKIGYSEGQIATIVYLCPFSNFDAFSTGCLAACLRKKASRMSTRFWFGVITALILALMSYFASRALVIEASFADVARSALSAETRSPSDQVVLYSFLALLASTLVICANNAPSRLPFFAIAPLIWLGELSYGIYMYHFPLLYIRSQFLPAAVSEPYAKLYGTIVLISYLTAVLVISYLSFRYIEKPFLNAPERSRRSRSWRAAH